ncbi:hypothetical protein DAPPUDRAFT_308231 [Daphnia pulex]|uniref:Uncharacterized protein n=1 Tax=Daphnia pulex TaxID=6669 RepID=E9H703_DAPPU|nr:hypothetical protein DAPPUDRAFT_308231 [Daphnia pulex]|eukprot:EFX72430.1 hypothetical protein DAPPUDRAFT_308231 [Daphnia pulex]
MSLYFILAACWLLLSHLQGLSSKESCLGGRSLRGLIELPSRHYNHDSNNITTVSCCDDPVVCHGGLALRNEQVEASFIINQQPLGHFDLQHQYAQQLVQSNDRDAAAAALQQRHKRSVINGGRCAGNKMACLPIQVRCCPANMSVFFPISAISALTGERVHVIQLPPLILQPVIYGRCEREQSSILDAECQQELTPEMMYVGRVDLETSDLELSREPVMVESGCSCRFNRQPLDIIDGIVMDETMTSFIDLWSE